MIRKFSKDEVQDAGEIAEKLRALAPFREDRFPVPETT